MNSNICQQRVLRDKEPPQCATMLLCKFAGFQIGQNNFNSNSAKPNLFDFHRLTRIYGVVEEDVDESILIKDLLKVIESQFYTQSGTEFIKLKHTNIFNKV